MWNKPLKKETTWQPNDRIVERQHKIYGMPFDFKEQILNFERKFLEFHEKNKEEFGCRTYEAYLQQVGAIINLEGTNFSIFNKNLYEDLQTLWDGLGELRRRRKYAEEKELESYVEFESEENLI